MAQNSPFYTAGGPRLAGLAPRYDGFGVQVLGQGDTQQAGYNSMQQRTFGLLARLGAAFRAYRFPDGYVPADTDPSTLDDGASAAVAHISDWRDYFKVDNTRMQVYEDVDEMDETSDEVSAALDTLADSAVNPEDGSERSFQIAIEAGPYRDMAEQIFEQVTESLDLQSNAFTIARNALKYGDCFMELVVDENVRLARGKILPAKTVYRNEDVAGNLMMEQPTYDSDGRCTNDPGACAFDQREQLNGKLIASFEPWQVVHFRWNRRGTERYGRSMLRTARLTWKKLRACEEAIVVARLQRAWMRFVHHVDVTGLNEEEARAALRRYRNGLQRAEQLDTQSREAPMEVTSDYFIGAGYVRDLDGTHYLQKQAKIEILQGDHSALQVMTDIEYFQNKLFASLRVPKAYLGFERDINAKATLTTQDIQFARVLRRIQSCLSVGYKDIFDFALLLNNIAPTDVEYEIHWPAILVSDEERDAIIRRLHAEADATYWQMGAPSTKYLVQQRFAMDDDQWQADLADAMVDPPPRIKVMSQMAKDTPGTGAATVADALAGASVNDIGDPHPISIDPLEQHGQQTTPANYDQTQNPMPTALPDDGTAGEEEGAGGNPYDYERHGLNGARRDWPARRPAIRVPSSIVVSVTGVHAVAPTIGKSGRKLSASASDVQRESEQLLGGFFVDLYRRKQQAGTRLARRARAASGETGATQMGQRPFQRVE